MDDRTVFHIDMDAFFASVEIALNPSLKGKPVIVAGDPDKRGVVSTCSYEARAYGVHSAMSSAEAKRLCPHGIFLHGNYGLYQEISGQVMELLQEVTYQTEIVSIDEAYMDVTEICKEMTPKNLGSELRKKVFDLTKLTCSIGIATNKLVAKVASSKAKPNGLLEIPPGRESAFFRPMPIGKIPGIGTKTQEFFYQEGIKTIGDLQDISLDEMTYRYGMRGYLFHNASFGRDNRPVCWEEGVPKSVGAETTFETDLETYEELAEKLDYVLEKAYRRLENEGMRAQGLSLKLRNGDFHTITRSMTFPTHTRDFDTLKSKAHHLFRYSWQREPLRLIGVTFEKLTDGYWQPLLWPWEEE